MIKLYVKSGWCHPKNMDALKKYKGLEVIPEEYGRLRDCQYVYSPSQIMVVNNYPDKKFVFGPHFQLDMEDFRLDAIIGPNSVYIQPCEMTIGYCRINSRGNKIKFLSMPFAVDTEKFKDIGKPRDKVFIYFKRRYDHELANVKGFLDSKHVDYKIFDYNKEYREDDYLSYLQSSKYGIIIDGSESQGFAIEEALSCNVPLLVWNIRYFEDSKIHPREKIPATKISYGEAKVISKRPGTSIPYWDGRCGEVFYGINEIQERYDTFISKLGTYKPRDYILENLSSEVCGKRFIDMLLKI